MDCNIKYSIAWPVKSYGGSGNLHDDIGRKP